MPITCKLEGRIGNIAYQLANLIAYCNRHGLDYYIPTEAPHQKNGKNPFAIKSTGDKPEHFKEYIEPKLRDNDKRELSMYKEIPQLMGDVCFRGYYQSFKYIDDIRPQVHEAFNMPYDKVKAVAIHVRRGDFLKAQGFSVLPPQYYKLAVNHFHQLGYNDFYVFSDDIPYCKDIFSHFMAMGIDETGEPIAENDINFIYMENGTEMDDFILMSCCEHQIVANSSFSFMAAWFNQNPYKIVICPDKYYCWYNLDYIPDYYTVINCPRLELVETVSQVNKRRNRA